MSLSALFCMSCSTNTPNLRQTDDVPLFIVKFKNPDEKAKVIASHAVIDWTYNNYDDPAGDYNYVFDTSCYSLINKSAYRDYQYDIMRDIVSISPYVELSEGYMLVDWRWQDYLPISYRKLYMNQRNTKYNSRHHIFFMNTSWIDLDSLPQTWHKDDILKNFEIVEWKTVSCQTLERYLKGDESPTSYFEALSRTSNKVDMDNKYDYVYTNHSFGETAYLKYKFEGGEEAYNRYAHVADSLYSVYAKGISELIRTNKLKKWTYEIPH